MNSVSYVIGRLQKWADKHADSKWLEDVMGAAELLAEMEQEVATLDQDQRDAANELADAYGHILHLQETVLGQKLLLKAAKERENRAADNEVELCCELEEAQAEYGALWVRHQRLVERAEALAVESDAYRKEAARLALANAELEKALAGRSNGHGCPQAKYEHKVAVD